MFIERLSGPNVNKKSRLDPSAATAEIISLGRDSRASRARWIF
jgi:hypothetical protein